MEQEKKSNVLKLQMLTGGIPLEAIYLSSGLFYYLPHLISILG